MKHLNLNEYEPWQQDLILKGYVTVPDKKYQDYVNEAISRGQKISTRNIKIEFTQEDMKNVYACEAN